MIRPYEVDAADMCDALSGVAGVEHVALEFDGRGNGVLRVRLAVGVDEDVVVGAAVAGLRRRFGLGVDASRLRLTGPSGRSVVAVVDGAAHPVGEDGEIVHVTSTTSEVVSTSAVQAPVPARGASPRVVVERVEIVSEHQEMRATVELSSEGALHRGTATAVATTSGTQRAVVTATARAVEAVVGSHARLDVEAVDLLRVGTDRVGVVVLTLLTERGIDRLTGSALVRDDGSDALVRATLNALNRRAETGRGRPSTTS